MTDETKVARAHTRGHVYTPHYTFKPYHPEDAHELRETCPDRLCKDVVHAVPMSNERFVSLLRWPNQQPTGRRPGEFYAGEEVPRG